MSVASLVRWEQVRWLHHVGRVSSGEELVRGDRSSGDEGRRSCRGATEETPQCQVRDVRSTPHTIVQQETKDFLIDRYSILQDIHSLGGMFYRNRVDAEAISTDMPTTWNSLSGFITRNRNFTATLHGVRTIQNLSVWQRQSAMWYTAIRLSGVHMHGYIGGLNGFQ